jgi:hypothetical protein
MAPRDDFFAELARGGGFLVPAADELEAPPVAPDTRALTGSLTWTRARGRVRFAASGRADPAPGGCSAPARSAASAVIGGRSLPG